MEALVMKVLGFLNLRRISGQIAALVVASIVMLHLIITAVFLMERRDPPDPFMHDGNAHLAAAVQLLGTAPASERPHLIAADNCTLLRGSIASREFNNNTCR